MLNCSQLTSRLTKRAGLLRRASTSGTAPSASANSLISFIGFAVPILLAIRSALRLPARKDLCRYAAGDRRASGKGQTIQKVRKNRHLFRAALHACHQIVDDLWIDLDLAVTKQLREHV